MALRLKARRSAGEARLLPGVALAGACAAIGQLVHAVIPPASALVVPFAVAVVLANVGAVGPSCRPGLRFAARKLLRIGIALVGLQLAAGDVLDLGAVGMVAVVAVVVLTFVGTWYLGRLLRLGHGLPILVAAGFSICGVSAVAAVEAMVEADEEDVAFAVALVTLCGTLAIAVLPLLRLPLGLQPEAFGAWVGAGVHDVAQVVATASTAGAASLQQAVVVKLARVLLLAPMVAGLALVVRNRGGTSAHGARPSLVPLFVLGFTAAVAVRTTGILSAGVLDAARTVQQVLLAMAMAGLGTGVDIRKLRGVGARPVALGLLSWMLVALLALGAVRATGA
jgi:uncharacterized integral membrane protein (TIGR00698 family)